MDEVVGRLNLQVVQAWGTAEDNKNQVKVLKADTGKLKKRADDMDNDITRLSTNFRNLNTDMSALKKSVEDNLQEARRDARALEARARDAADRLWSFEITMNGQKVLLQSQGERIQQLEAIVAESATQRQLRSVLMWILIVTISIVLAITWLVKMCRDLWT